MIEEIKKLRRKGLSFRKIAEELNTTVGKVQYQWKKYKKKEESIAVKKRQVRVSKSAIRGRYLNNKRLVTVEKEHLTAWILSENKWFVFWRLSEIKKDLVSGYFDQAFNSFQKVLRLYDVTQIRFNGSNTHPILEERLKEGQTVSFLKQPQPNRCYIMEMGILVPGQRFFPLLRTNPVHLPKNCRNQSLLGNEEKDSSERTLPEWAEHVSTYSYYESISKKDDGS